MTQFAFLLFAFAAWADQKIYSPPIKRCTDVFSQAFEITQFAPADFQFTTVPPEYFSAFNDSAQMASERAARALGPLRQYQGAILEMKDYLNFLSTEGGQQQAALKRPDTVLYPLSGTDSFLPSVIFTEAPRIVLVDKHPFARNLNPMEFTLPNEVPGFRNFLSVGEDGIVGARILSNLAIARPGLRVHSVTLFGRKGQEAANAIVEFDQGVDSPKQTLYFINDQLGAGQPLNKTWWMRSLENSKLAVIIKGAQGFHMTTAGHDLFEFAKALPFSLVLASSAEVEFTPRELARPPIKWPNLVIGIHRVIENYENFTGVFVLSDRP
jgi:hypothetical protein